MNKDTILELRTAGYTWNQIDQMVLPPEQIKRNKDGKIVSQAFKFAKLHNIEGAFTKQVIGAYTPTQIVVPIRRFNPFPKVEKKEEGRITMADLGL